MISKDFIRLFWNTIETVTTLSLLIFLKYNINFVVFIFRVIELPLTNCHCKLSNFSPFSPPTIFTKFSRFHLHLWMNCIHSSGVSSTIWSNCERLDRETSISLITSIMCIRKHIFDMSSGLNLRRYSVVLDIFLTCFRK